MNPGLNELKTLENSLPGFFYMALLGYFYPVTKSNSMNIKILVYDYLIQETIIDNTIEVNGDYEIAEANHKAFRELYPNCQVNFIMDTRNFLMSPPLNMQKDEIAQQEGRITWQEFMDKWYAGTIERFDDDMPY